MSKESILDILSKRPIIGDGSYVFTLEKRGYVKGGPWTPEAVIEYPNAGKNEDRFLWMCVLVHTMQPEKNIFLMQHRAQVAHKCIFSVSFFNTRCTLFYTS